MPTQTEIQQNVTSRIIEGLKNGTVPWRKPWRNDPNTGLPTNVVSKRKYSGINPLLLNLVAISRDYQSRWWGTYHQWQSLGAQVMKRPDDVEPGNWGTNIVFFNIVKKTKKDAAGEDKIESFPFMRYFTVFNLEQVEGEAVSHLRPTQDMSCGNADPDYAEAENVIGATGADIRYGGNRAAYARPIGAYPNHTDGDYIRMPAMDNFMLRQEFYSTLFHEISHWSECRLGWTGSYAMGELIAEMSSCFLCASTNIPSSDDVSNHTAYLAEWLKALENDRKYIFKAATQASKACEFILKFSQSKEENSELEAVEA